MKIDAKIEWVIDDAQLGIESGRVDTILIDEDYVSADELDIQNWIENELAEKYGVSLLMSKSETDDGDFIIKNMDELLEELSYSEFEDKVDPGYEE